MPQVENIPTGANPVELKEIELKNVLVKGLPDENIKVRIVPFDRYNEAHVSFAYEYSDMLFKAPSPFKNINEAARGYVKIFVAHIVDEEKDEKSNFNKVLNDLRACRTLFNQDDIMIALNDFFENA